MNVMKIGAFAIAVAFSSGAQAGVYSDDLGKCLVKHTTDTDKLTLIKWVVLGFAQHHAVQPYIEISKDKITAIDEEMGHLYERLLTVDCRTETVTALKYEGTSALPNSFELLAQIAGQQVTQDAHVSDAMSGFTTYMDNNKLAALSKEAGVKMQDDSATPPK